MSIKIYIFISSYGFFSFKFEVQSSFFQNDDLNLFFGFFGGMESRREFPKGEKDIYCDHSTKNQLTGAPSDDKESESNEES